MITMKNFLELVEIRTKLASLFPFLIGLFFSIYYFDQINSRNMLLFFLAMLLFDMATTAINNLMDFKKAKDKDYQDNTNIIGVANLNVQHVRLLIFGMIFVSAVIGLYLTYQTNILLLGMGGICFLIGIFYTYGPVPLSRMPLGEIFSGLTMGFGIFFITVYLNIFDAGVLGISFSNGEFMIYGQILDLLVLFWTSLPLIFTISNIMLANNLCDLKQDTDNQRYTLPYYIGKKKGVLLFNVLNYAPYIVILIGVLIGIYHWVMLLVFLTLPKIKKNVSKFNKEQHKEKTFSVAIKNLILFNGTELLMLIISVLFQK